MKDRKKSKGRRQPLSKLPRHHPLLMKDGLSDDGKFYPLHLPNGLLCLAGL